VHGRQQHQITRTECDIVKQEAFEKCWAHSPLRAAARPNFTLPFTRCRYCRTPTAHRCPQQRQQRQRVTEGTAIWPHRMGPIKCCTLMEAIGCVITMHGYIQQHLAADAGYSDIYRTNEMILHYRLFVAWNLVHRTQQSSWFWSAFDSGRSPNLLCWRCFVISLDKQRSWTNSQHITTWNIQLPVQCICGVWWWRNLPILQKYQRIRPRLFIFTVWDIIFSW